jgi:head-tail adaptor
MIHQSITGTLSPFCFSIVATAPPFPPLNNSRYPVSFAEKGDVILASVRAYKEDKHGSEKWANRAAFSQASALFRFRRIPNLEITTDLVLVCSDGRYNIISVEDVKGRGMYIEVLAEKVKSSKA